MYILKRSLLLLYGEWIVGEGAERKRNITQEAFSGKCGERVDVLEVYLEQ